MLWAFWICGSIDLETGKQSDHLIWQDSAEVDTAIGLDDRLQRCFHRS